MTLFMAIVPFTAFTQDEQVPKIRYYDRTFQLSLFPGISTNGVSCGSYFNKYSLNIFGGINAGTQNFELGLFTNAHFRSSSGFQFAGLANITGANAFVNLTLSEERALRHDGFEVNNHGIQIAGLLNYVLDNAAGIQITGGLNHAGKGFKGLQVAGIGNSAGGFTAGVHLAGFYNLAKKSVAGIQLSAMFNYTDEYLSGTQVALINKARWMQGRNSTPSTKARSLQIGLLNFSREMHGTQIGLINFGGEARGKQIGLINFYRKLKSKELANAGTPVGLLNFGSTGSVLRAHFNEIFPTNIEYTTGNCQNCTWTVVGPVGMPYTENNKKLNQNALILGYDRNHDTWGFGWGFQKILLNKASIRPFDKRNEMRMISYGVRFLHLSRQWMEIDDKFNVVSRFHFEWGRRGVKYLKSVYRYAGVALNYFVRDAAIPSSAFTVKSPTFPAGKWGNYHALFWPGYSVGVQL